MSLELFKLVTDNPNPGGSCLCHKGPAPGCEGPFVLFNTMEMGSNTDPHPVVGRRCLLAAARRVQSEEGVITTQQFAEADPEPEPNVAFGDLPPNVQESLKTFPPGSLVKVTEGEYVEVPVDGTAEPEPDAEDPLALLAGDVPEAPQEDPGDRPGEFVPVQED